MNLTFVAAPEESASAMLLAELQTYWPTMLVLLEPIAGLGRRIWFHVVPAIGAAAEKLQPDPGAEIDVVVAEAGVLPEATWLVDIFTKIAGGVCAKRKAWAGSKHASKAAFAESLTSSETSFIGGYTARGF